jgi:hypothetical protein
MDVEVLGATVGGIFVRSDLLQAEAKKVEGSAKIR